MTAQLALDLRSLKAQRSRDLMADALAWIDANRSAWTNIVMIAEADAARYGRVRVKHAIETVRFGPVAATDKRPKLPNAYSAPFGRILASWYPHLAEAVPLHNSKCDGCSIPPKPVWA